MVFACGNSLVCETMEDARRVAFGGSERKKVRRYDVLLEAKVAYKSYASQSGSLGKIPPHSGPYPCISFTWHFVSILLT